MAEFKRKKISKRIKNSMINRINLFKKQKRETALFKRTKEFNKKVKRGKKMQFLKTLFLIFLILGFMSAGSVFLWVSSLEIPSVEIIRNLKVAQSTKIYDKNGILLYRLYGDESRTIIPISKISKHAIHAAVAVEDKDFYEHSGIKPASIIKAAYENFTKKRKYTRGGSTITQQVIKNTILTPEKTITRKVKEAILAYKLEKLWTKDQILELYLNESPYGGTLYGIEEASSYYFNKHAEDLNIAESAYLAAMPQAPTTYSPYGKHREDLDNRKDLILRLMFQQGYINVDEYKESKKEVVEFVFKKGNPRIKAPHFVMYIVEQLKNKFGEEVRTSGLNVHTTLDIILQEELEKIAKEKIEEAEEDLSISNAGVVVIEPKTGNILAMVGSIDYFEKNIDGKYNIVTALRQPGSTFKPVVYLTALQQGYTPKTILWDVETEFSAGCFEEDELESEEEKEKLTDKERREKGCYAPVNFDKKYRGPVTIEQALAESRNIPAVKALYLAGLSNSLENAQLFGLDSLNRSINHYGLNLVLGGGEVQLLSLASVYGMFANEGIKTLPISIKEIFDAEGDIIFESEQEPKRVVDSKYVKQLNKILSNNELKYPTYGRYSDLYYEDREVAVKTGTTNDFKDFWAIGYDPENVVVGVWVGNNDNKPASSFKAGQVAHKIWRASMDVALRNSVGSSFSEEESLTDLSTKPVFRGIYQGGQTIRLDTKSGTLATEETPEEFIEEIAIPEYHSILHWVDKKNPRGPVPGMDNKDANYKNWEKGVQDWILGENHQDAIQTDLIKALEGMVILINSGVLLNNTENDENKPKEERANNIDFFVLSPNDGDKFDENENVHLKMKQEENSSDIKKYYFYLNDNYIGSTNLNNFKFNLSDVDGVLKENFLKIEAEDKYKNTDFRMLKLMVN